MPEGEDGAVGQAAQWAYQTVLKAAGPKQAEKLREAKRLWIKYRDADCLHYDLDEGTIARVEAGYCVPDITKSRPKERKQALEVYGARCRLRIGVCGRQD